MSCLIKVWQIFLSSLRMAKIKIRLINTEPYYKLVWFSSRFDKCRLTQSFFLPLRAGVQETAALFPSVQLPPACRCCCTDKSFLFSIEISSSFSLNLLKIRDKMDFWVTWCWPDIQREVFRDVIHCTFIGWSQDLGVCHCTEMFTAVSAQAWVLFSFKLDDYLLYVVALMQFNSPLKIEPALVLWASGPLFFSPASSLRNTMAMRRSECNLTA